MSELPSTSVALQVKSGNTKACAPGSVASTKHHHRLRSVRSARDWWQRTGLPRPVAVIEYHPDLEEDCRLVRSSWSQLQRSVMA